MERRKFTREFKLEAVRLIKDRGVSYVQASQDLGVHTSQLRDWVTMLKQIERMGRADLTVHGFRSTFHDWASEGLTSRTRLSKWHWRTPSRTKLRPHTLDHRLDHFHDCPHCDGKANIPVH